MLVLNAKRKALVIEVVVNTKIFLPWVLLEEKHHFIYRCLWNRIMQIVCKFFLFFKTVIRSKQSFVRVSLLQLQRMIDLNRIDVTKPIDLTSFANTKLLSMNFELDRYSGIHLISEVIWRY